MTQLPTSQGAEPEHKIPDLVLNPDILAFFCALRSSGDMSVLVSDLTFSSAVTFLS